MELRSTTPEEKRPSVPAKTTRRAARTRKALFGAAAMVLGLAVSGLIGEGLARLLMPLKYPYMNIWPRPAWNYYVPDADCGYVHPPNYPPKRTPNWDGRTFNLCVTNRLGMHDVEPPPFEPDQVRILVLGCSMTENWTVEDLSQTWPRRFEVELNRDRQPDEPRFVVFNGGMNGYNSFQQTALGRRLSGELRPHIWLMAYLGGTASMWGRNLYGPAGEYRLKWGDLWSADLLAALEDGRPRWSRALMDLSVLWRWLALTTADLEHVRAGRAWEYTDPKDANSDALRGFRDAARAAGAEPIVAYIPGVDLLDYLRAGHDDPTAPQVEVICQRLELPFVDPTAAMLGAAAAQWGADRPLLGVWSLSERDYHYNPAASAAYARVLADALRPRLASWARPEGGSPQPLDRSLPVDRRIE